MNTYTHIYTYKHTYNHKLSRAQTKSRHTLHTHTHKHSGFLLKQHHAHAHCQGKIMFIEKIPLGKCLQEQVSISTSSSSSSSSSSFFGSSMRTTIYFKRALKLGALGDTSIHLLYVPYTNSTCSVLAPTSSSSSPHTHVLKRFAKVSD